MKKIAGKINGWDKAYKKEPQQFVEPEKICSLADILFKKYGVKRILDLGCGNGRHLVYFGKAGYEVYGSDLSGWGLQAASTWLRKESIPSRLSLADMQVLPFKDESFDAIISFRVIQHNLFADIQATFKELERILRKDGLFIGDVLKYDPESDRFKEWEMVEPNTFVPRSGTEKGMPHHAFTKKEVFDLLSAWKIQFFNTPPGKHHFDIIAQK
ncbi:MAG TPA: class I SAM-dependent methyltransferase [Anaerolineaceae bacterium]|jgi:ubiquinone/menaquinone biosynthesis C-methylase UbiE|nr:class I SAM-dependent methyltransferase [Anaerolineaceae bacterium]